MDGILLIDKPEKLTSFDVCYKIKKKLKVRKTGHGGTLDPFGTGLLIVGVNKGTRILSYFSEAYKVYRGIICLGEKRDTFDITGTTVEKNIVENISEDKILKTRDKFLGEINQKPPVYSALKHKGRSLYKYAREGINIEKEPRKILIEKFDILKINLPEIEFRIKCSKGTYIRSIANDFGESLGTLGYLGVLRREEIGDYSVDKSVSIECVDESNIIPFENVLNFKKIYLNEKYKKFLENGQEIAGSYVDNFLAGIKHKESVYIICENIVAICQFDSENNLFKPNMVYKKTLQ